MSEFNVREVQKAVAELISPLVGADADKIVRIEMTAMELVVESVDQRGARVLTTSWSAIQAWVDGLKS